jgi:hypothetical protein
LPSGPFSPTGAFASGVSPGVILSDIALVGPEEPRWRGFGETRLRRRYSAFAAGFLVGISWVVGPVTVFDPRDLTVRSPGQPVRRDWPDAGRIVRLDVRSIGGSVAVHGGVRRVAGMIRRRRRRRLDVARSRLRTDSGRRRGDCRLRSRSALTPTEDFQFTGTTGRLRRHR